MTKNHYFVAGVGILILLLAGWQLFLRPASQTFQTTPVPTNSAMLESGKNIEIVTEEAAYYKNVKGYLAKPKDAAMYPGVVMIHENRGLRPEFKAMADELAKQGFMVLAVDLYYGKVVDTQKEARTLSSAFKQEEAIVNLKAAKAYLKNQGATKIASLGWCFGGGQSLQLALSGEQLDATVIYYGRLATDSAKLAQIKWPVLGIFGGADQSISVESVNQFKDALDSLKVVNEIHIYPGVGHAFANPSGASYAPNETKDAWAKTLRFLSENLKSG